MILNNLRLATAASALQSLPIGDFADFMLSLLRMGSSPGIAFPRLYGEGAQVRAVLEFIKSRTAEDMETGSLQCRDHKN